MNIATSYFYQIRNFKNYMIPLSTAMYDPKWYHDFKDNKNVFVDKRGIINGIRCEDLKPGITCKDLCNGKENCSTKDPTICKFLKNYRHQLNKLDFNLFLEELTDFSDTAKIQLELNLDPTLVLIFYETPTNSCSERNTVIQWFRDNNFFIDELKYPIEENY